MTCLIMTRILLVTEMNSNGVAFLSICAVFFCSNNTSNHAHFISEWIGNKNIFSKTHSKFVMSGLFNTNIYWENEPFFSLLYSRIYCPQKDAVSYVIPGLR